MGLAGVSLQLGTGFHPGCLPTPCCVGATLGRLRAQPGIKAQYKVEAWGVSAEEPGRVCALSDIKSRWSQDQSKNCAWVGSGLSAGKGLRLGSEQRATVCSEWVPPGEL